MGHALLAPHLPFDSPTESATRPSLPRLLFLDPQVRGSYVEWQKEACTHVAYLRRISGKYLDDTRLAELGMKDPEFASLWASGHVGECTGGVKNFRHPLVGELTVEFQIWLQADSPDHRLEIYTPTDQMSADALTLLATLTHDEQPVRAESLPGRGAAELPATCPPPQERAIRPSSE